MMELLAERVLKKTYMKKKKKNKKGTYMRKKGFLLEGFNAVFIRLRKLLQLLLKRYACTPVSKK